MVTVICHCQVGSATKSIHDRLQQIQDEGWKNNEIAEKIKQTKQQELEMLQNRWKNGVLREDGAEPVRMGNHLLNIVAIVLNAKV